MSYREISFISQQGKSSLRTRPGELRERHNPYTEHTRLFSFQQTRGAEFGVHNGHQITVYSHPNDEGLVSLKYFLDKREVKDPPTDTLVRMAESVLTLNTFEFNGEYYKQVGGLAMGSR